EPGDLWRFWKIRDPEFPVECGTEDTAISSIVLEKLGYTLRNKRVLRTCISKSGAILTWIKADYKLLLLNPISFLWLKRFEKFSRKTIDAKMFDYNDAEPVITATVLSYLKETRQTEIVVNYLLNNWNNNNFDVKQFYDKKIIFAFHIARAY